MPPAPSLNNPSPNPDSSLWLRQKLKIRDILPTLAMAGRYSTACWIPGRCLPFRRSAAPDGRGRVYRPLNASSGNTSTPLLGEVAGLRRGHSVGRGSRWTWVGAGLRRPRRRTFRRFPGGWGCPGHPGDWAAGVLVSGALAIAARWWTRIPYREYDPGGAGRQDPRVRWPASSTAAARVTSLS